MALTTIIANTDCADSKPLTFMTRPISEITKCETPYAKIGDYLPCDCGTKVYLNAKGNYVKFKELNLEEKKKASQRAGKIAEVTKKIDGIKRSGGNASITAPLDIASKGKILRTQEGKSISLANQTIAKQAINLKTGKAVLEINSSK